MLVLSIRKSSFFNTIVELVGVIMAGTLLLRHVSFFLLHSQFLHGQWFDIDLRASFPIN